MSKISAVICELNPLHIGHKYIFDKARKCSDTVVAVMSGNFVQRGECAVFHKYNRAKAALACGADLVLELPFPWCAAPAQFFALGAMSIVSAVGADVLVFGSECGDTELLLKAAEAVQTEEFKSAVEREYTENVGFAVARERAAKSIMPKAAELFSSSNDMLALEYIINAKNTGFKGSFYGEKRLNCEGYLSASAIRGLLEKEEIEKATSVIPREVKEIFDESLSQMAFLSKLEELEFWALRLRKTDSETFDFESGIVSRLLKCADTSLCGKSMFEAAATKKYTDARIRRAALFALCGVTKDALQKKPDFTVVLGANEKGRQVLSKMRKSDSVKNGNFTLITKPSDLLTVKGGEQSERADRLYTLLFDKAKEAGFFLTRSPLMK